jgi:hypothetical protein
MENAHEPLKQPVEVECYSGFRYGERPLSFKSGGRRFLVEEVEASWFEEGPESEGRPRKRFFRVRADDGCNYLLSWNESEDQWLLEPVDRRKREHRNSGRGV